MNNWDTNDALQCLRSYMRPVDFGCKNCVIKTKSYFHCHGSKTQKYNSLCMYERSKALDNGTLIM